MTSLARTGLAPRSRRAYFTIMHQPVGIGYQTFVDDDPEDFGAVRAVSKDGFVVYVENAGEFTIPASAVTSVQSQKVTFACSRLDRRLRAAIGHAHDAEDIDGSPV